MTTREKREKRTEIPEVILSRLRTGEVHGDVRAWLCQGAEARDALAQAKAAFPNEKFPWGEAEVKRLEAEERRRKLRAASASEAERLNDADPAHEVIEEVDDDESNDNNKEEL